MEGNQLNIKTFPLKLTEPFNEKVTEAVKKTPLNKHDWIVRAIMEKLERDRAV